MNCDKGDRIFKYLFRCQQKKECVWYGNVLVDCARIDGAIGIISNNTEWVGNRIQAANRLAMMNVEINDDGSPCGVEE